jgi:hypothetical protein
MIKMLVQSRVILVLNDSDTLNTIYNNALEMPLQEARLKLGPILEVDSGESPRPITSSPVTWGDIKSVYGKLLTPFEIIPVPTVLPMQRLKSSIAM